MSTSRQYGQEGIIMGSTRMTIVIDNGFIARQRGMDVNGLGLARL
jgi:hypothetical protein